MLCRNKVCLRSGTRRVLRDMGRSTNGTLDRTAISALAVHMSRTRVAGYDGKGRKCEVPRQGCFIETYHYTGRPTQPVDTPISPEPSPLTQENCMILLIPFAAISSHSWTEIRFCCALHSRSNAPCGLEVSLESYKISGLGRLYGSLKSRICRFRIWNARVMTCARMHSIGNPWVS